MILNKILSLTVIICSTLFIFGLIPNTFIKNNISPWSYYLIFLIPLLLFMVISRFTKTNDVIGKRLSYISIFSFIAAPFLPVLITFIFWGSSFSLDGTLSLVVLGVLPSIGIILSIYVSTLLWKNKKIEATYIENPYN